MLKQLAAIGIAKEKRKPRLGLCLCNLLVLCGGRRTEEEEEEAEEEEEEEKEKEEEKAHLFRASHLAKGEHVVRLSSA